MSSTDEIGPLNPPPAGPLIPSSYKANKITVGTSNFEAPWPVKALTTPITTNIVIDYTTTPYNYIPVESNLAPLTVTYRGLPIGAMFVAEITGAGSVLFRSLISNSGGVDQFINGSALTAGTYILVVFPTAIVSTSLGNPTTV